MQLLDLAPACVQVLAELGALSLQRSDELLQPVNLGAVVDGAPRPCWSVWSVGWSVGWLVMPVGRDVRPTDQTDRVDDPLTIHSLAGQRATPHTKPHGLTGDTELGRSFLEREADGRVAGWLVGRLVGWLIGGWLAGHTQRVATDRPTRAR